MSGIYTTKDPYMQNMGTFGSQGAILGALSHTKLGFAFPFLLIPMNLVEQGRDLTDFTNNFYFDFAV